MERCGQFEPVPNERNWLSRKRVVVDPVVVYDDLSREKCIKVGSPNRRWRTRSSRDESMFVSSLSVSNVLNIFGETTRYFG
jgi:hypothetical protein